MERVRREHEPETQQRSAPVAPAPVPAEQILRLQQGAGNAAVARMLAREPADTAPDLEAPAQMFSADQLTELLSHLQAQIAIAQQESDRNQVAEHQAERAGAAESALEPKKRSGLFGTLAKPVRRLGSALKKAGAWLGVGGKTKPAAAAPEASAARSAEADRKQMAAMIATLDTMIQEKTAELGEHMDSMNDAVELVADVIDPAERQEIVRQQPA